MLLCSFISYYRKSKCKDFNILSSHYCIYSGRGEGVHLQSQLLTCTEIRQQEPQTLWSGLFTEY